MNEWMCVFEFLSMKCVYLKIMSIYWMYKAFIECQYTFMCDSFSFTKNSMHCWLQWEKRHRWWKMMNKCVFLSVCVRVRFWEWMSKKIEQKYGWSGSLPFEIWFWEWQRKVQHEIEINNGTKHTNENDKANMSDLFYLVMNIRSEMDL